ncbi:MAG: phosphoadenosine phosphosulfate reductase family protein [Armatimonadia bacterium]
MSDSGTPQQAGNTRHILSLSGGKDSTALAIHLRDRMPDMEYVFCDTDKELDETYDYLDRLEVYLGRPIIRLKHDGMGFDDLLSIRRGYLPSPQIRWCTEYLKLKPFEKFIGETPAVTYVGIRADERHRKGYLSTKPNIVACFPFIEEGINRAGVLRILEESGLGLPDYYRWRSRSGCYFCFFQQRREWVGLMREHPGLFKQAMEYEKADTDTGQRYTWVQGESLEELSRPERVAQIEAEFEQRRERAGGFRAGVSLGEVLDDADDSADRGCLICAL